MDIFLVRGPRGPVVGFSVPEINEIVERLPNAVVILRRACALHPSYGVPDFLQGHGLAGTVGVVVPLGSEGGYGRELPALARRYRLGWARGR